jgi:hypothetical protein
VHSPTTDIVRVNPIEDELAIQLRAVKQLSQQVQMQSKMREMFTNEGLLSYVPFLNKRKNVANRKSKSRQSRRRQTDTSQREDILLESIENLNPNITAQRHFFRRRKTTNPKWTQ